MTEKKQRSEGLTRESDQGLRQRSEPGLRQGNECDLDQLVPAHEQRQEFRLTGRIRVRIEVEAPDHDHAGRSLRGSSSDISANGLRIVCAEPLPEGAILPLHIQLEAHEFLLTGEVKWCFPAGHGVDSGYIAGFALYESDQTSILEWKEAIVRLLAE